MDFSPKQQFIVTLDDFLSTMCETFPDDEAILAHRRAFDTLARNNVIAQDALCKAYHRQMSPYYEACERKDPTPFMEGRIEILVQIGFREKYADLTDESLYDDKKVMQDNIDNVWAFIAKLNYYATLHAVIPASIMERVVESATEMVENGEDDDGDLRCPDPVTLFKISTSILGGLSQGDQDQFMVNLPQLLRGVNTPMVREQAAAAGVDVGSLMEVLQSAMGGMIPTNASASANPFMAMLATLAGQGAPGDNRPNSGGAPNQDDPALDAPAPDASSVPNQDTTRRRRAGWRPPGSGR